MKNGEREAEIVSLLSVSERSVQAWTKDARKSEKDEQQAKAWDLWLDCLSDVAIAKEIGVTDKTAKELRSEFAQKCDFSEPPTSRQHFDVWDFQKSDGQSSYFGKLPPQVVENLLWLYTEPGQIVVDPLLALVRRLVAVGTQHGQLVGALIAQVPVRQVVHVE